MWWCPFSSNSQPMASSFPSPLLNLPLSSSSLSNSTAVGAITTGVCWRSGGRRSRGRTVIANATEKEEQGKDSPAFNPFGFVTDNPSSRSAIQLPESPAEDGNVGQMLYVRPFYFLWLCVVFIVFFWYKFYRLSCFFIFFFMNSLDYLLKMCNSVLLYHLFGFSFLPNFLNCVLKLCNSGFQMRSFVNVRGFFIPLLNPQIVFLNLSLNLFGQYSLLSFYMVLVRICRAFSFILFFYFGLIF